MKSKTIFPFPKKDRKDAGRHLLQFQQTVIAGEDQFFYFDFPLDLFYLTGLSLSAGKLFIDKKSAILFVDSRYIQMAENESVIPVCLAGEKNEIDYFRKKSIAELVFDSERTTYAGYLTLQAFCEKIQSKKNFPLTPMRCPLKTLKMHKDFAELEEIRASSRVLWKAFQHLKKWMNEGVTEKELAIEFEVFSRKNGAEGLAFDPIIAFGSQSSMPHYQPGDNKLKKNTHVLVDAGVVVNRYHSDMTRVVFFGKPDPFFLEMYALLKKAKHAAEKICRPGTPAGKLDAAVREFLKEHDLEQYFVHSLGHGIGLETHESPRIKWDGEDRDLILEPNMVITIEPGLYFPGKGGLRYEDTVIITEDGFENLYPIDEGAG